MMCYVNVETSEIIGNGEVLRLQVHEVEYTGK
jgi:hypothetical protein